VSCADYNRRDVCICEAPGVREVGLSVESVLATLSKTRLVELARALDVDVSLSGTKEQQIRALLGLIRRVH
jgi:hypothetical protein